ncbi:MAG: hypothetical protein ACO3UX_10175, partial [Candidatus Nanopelagicales bacterium]
MSDWLGLAGRVATVTGAGSGIGRACALALADELQRKDRTIRDQNKVIAQLQRQLGGDAELWSKTEGFGDGASG